MRNPEKYTREYRNAVTRKWRHEHPERTKEVAIKNNRLMEERHPGYFEQKSQEWKKRQENIKQRRAVDNVHNHFREIKGSCSKCGSTENLERHHPDYSKPLEFIVLCRKCHRTLHHKPYAEILVKTGFVPMSERDYKTGRI
jgi:hypothetical protein